MRQRVAIGISNHVAGPDLPAMVARMNKQDPQLLVEVHIAKSGDVLRRYDRREFDTVIVRIDVGRDDEECLTGEPFCWFASPGLNDNNRDPLPVATMAEPCGVRAIAAELLDEAGVEWTEVFVGGGVPAVASAVVAGVGVAAMAPRMLPFGVLDVEGQARAAAAAEPADRVHTRVKDDRPKAVLSALAAAFPSITGP